MNIKETWNLKLLYKSDTDPQIEKDIKALEQAAAAFEKKYKGKDFTSTPEKLKRALDAYETLLRVGQDNKPWRYFHLKNDTNSADEKVAARLVQIRERIVAAGNRTTFLKLALGRVPGTLQKAYLKHPLLKDYAYMLKVLFEGAKHHLPEGEEQLASLLSQPGMTSWTTGQSKLLNAQSVSYKGEDLPIPKATAMINELPKGERKALNDALNTTVKSVAHFAEAEINAIVTYKKIMDERRGYKKPYSATIASYENDEKTVENLIALVSKNFRISQRFFKLQAKIQKEKKINFADRNAKMGEVKKKFTFAETCELVMQSFAEVDPKYPAIFKSYLENGQVDVYPRRGKRDGAYCSGGGDMPTYILLNHTDNMRSYETLAHEMGHAFHTELSRVQPFHYRDYTMSVAEVASTFFEQVALAKLEKVLDEKDYLISLHNRINGDLSTIFLQTTLFNFETELHNRIRMEGALSGVDMAKLMKKHFKRFLGDAVEMSDDDGYFFVRLPHVRYFFYVYSYVYGQLISRALFEKWKADPSYIKKIEQFLSAGSSMSPKDIFKKIGIDTSDPAFFATGLKAIERDIAKLEKLVSRAK